MLRGLRHECLTGDQAAGPRHPAPSDGFVQQKAPQGSLHTACLHVLWSGRRAGFRSSKVWWSAFALEPSPHRHFSRTPDDSTVHMTRTSGMWSNLLTLTERRMLPQREAATAITAGSDWRAAANVSKPPMLACSKYGQSHLTQTVECDCMRAPGATGGRRGEGGAAVVVQSSTMR